MKKIIRLTESDLTRIVKQIISENDKKLKSLNEGAVLKYSNPLPAEISKSLDKKNKNGKVKHNVFKIVTKNTTRYYSIIGNTYITGRHELNFKDIVKKSNGDMVFNRFVKGGVESQNIPFSKMKTLLIAMSKGQQKINPSTGLYFNKLS
tara:strand:- start:3459 stop:3905 length:447 start_codon:yes stop_codon:yes gene_type:complete